MISPSCHPDRRHKARGLCSACYARSRSDRRPTCHPDRLLNRRQGTLCRQCYWDQVTLPARRRRGRERALRLLYGLTADDYYALLAAQGGRCAICGTEPAAQALAVDHNHETDAIRGLLCGPCNQAIGSFEDDPDRLRAAAAYLEAASLRAARSA